MIEDTKLKKAINNLLDLQIGFCLEIQGSFYIREIEGPYAVGFTEYEEDWEKVFEDREEAIDFFIKKRKELLIGDDFVRENVEVDGIIYEHQSHVNPSLREVIFVPLIEGQEYCVQVIYPENIMNELIERDNKEKFHPWNPVKEDKAKTIIREIVKQKPNNNLRTKFIFDSNNQLKDITNGST